MNDTASVWTNEGYADLDLIKLGLGNSTIVPLGDGKYIIGSAGRLQPGDIALANYKTFDDQGQYDVNASLQKLFDDCNAYMPDFSTSDLKDAIQRYKSANISIPKNHEDMIYYGAVMDAEMMGYTLTKTTATTPQPGESLVYLVFSTNSVTGAYRDYHWYVQNAPDTNGEITWSHKPGSGQAINSQPVYKYTHRVDSNGNLMWDIAGKPMWDVEPMGAPLGGPITDPATSGATQVIKYYYDPYGNLIPQLLSESGKVIFEYNQYMPSNSSASGVYILAPK